MRLVKRWSLLTWLVGLVAVVLAVAVLTGASQAWVALPPTVGWFMARTQVDDAERRLRGLSRDVRHALAGAVVPDGEAHQ
jgi:hypothetical protein